MARWRDLMVPVLLRGMPEHQRPVNPVRGLFAKLFRQCVMRAIVFGDDQNTAGVAIEAMHDAGTIFGEAQRQFLHVVKQEY